MLINSLIKLFTPQSQNICDYLNKFISIGNKLELNLNFKNDNKIIYIIYDVLYDNKKNIYLYNIYNKTDVNHTFIKYYLTCISTLIEYKNKIKHNEFNSSFNKMLNNYLNSQIVLMINSDKKDENSVYIKNKTCGILTMLLYYFLNTIIKYNDIESILILDMNLYKIKNKIDIIYLINNLTDNYVHTIYDNYHTLNIIKNNNKIYFIQSWFSSHDEYNLYYNKTFSELSFYVYCDEIDCHMINKIINYLKSIYDDCFNHIGYDYHKDDFNIFYEHSYKIVSSELTLYYLTIILKLLDNNHLNTKKI